MSITTVKIHTDCGPYFPPTRGSYQCTKLQETIFHIRQAMEDHEDYIGLFHGDKCKGVWVNEWEGEPDGEGGMQRGPSAYVLYRTGPSPLSGWINSIVNVLRDGR